MTRSIWSLLLGALLLGCFASFRWGMSKFFSRPAGSTFGMKVISTCGAGFAIVHLAAVLLTPEITRAGGLFASLLYLCALGLFWWAIRANSPRPLSAAFSPDSPHHLMDQGPYRWMRHPFYCSYLLTWGAGIVATGNLWLLPTLIVMLGIYIRAAQMEEEKFTNSPLASSYVHYRSRTGLFFPNPVKIMVRRSS